MDKDSKLNIKDRMHNHTAYNHDISNDENPKSNYDYINPEHYNNSHKEVWQMMIDIWGVDKFIAFCQMTSFKYRQRMGLKPNESVEKEIQKANWYDKKAKELQDNK